MNTLAFLPPLLIAAFLGALIGMEREWRGKDAGIRTNSIVALASCAFTLIAFEILKEYESLDVTRLISATISGVGFLGAGVVLKNGQEIKGLTTAAEIWLVASLGIAVGTGLTAFAFMIAGVALAFTIILQPVSAHFKKKH